MSTLSSTTGSSSTASSGCSKSKTSSTSKLCPKSRPFGAGLFLSKIKKNKKKQRKNNEQSDSSTQQQQQQQRSSTPEYQRNLLKKFKLGTKLSVTCGTALKKHTAELADLAYAYPGNDSGESKGCSRSLFSDQSGSGQPSSSIISDSVILSRPRSDSMFPDDVLLDSNSSSRDSGQANEVGSRKGITKELTECMSSQELIWCR